MASIKLNSTQLVEFLTRHYQLELDREVSIELPQSTKEEIERQNVVINLGTKYPPQRGGPHDL